MQDQAVFRVHMVGFKIVPQREMLASIRATRKGHHFQLRHNLKAFLVVILNQITLRLAVSLVSMLTLLNNFLGSSNHNHLLFSNKRIILEINQVSNLQQ